MDANTMRIAGLVHDDTLAVWMTDAIRRRLAADRAADEYEYEKPRIEEAIRKRLTKRDGKDIDFFLRQEMEANWKLIDLTKKHAWLRDEAASLNLAIQTQLALRAAIAVEVREETRS